MIEANLGGNYGILHVAYEAYQRNIEIVALRRQVDNLTLVFNKDQDLADIMAYLSAIKVPGETYIVYNAAEKLGELV